MDHWTSKVPENELPSKEAMKAMPWHKRPSSINSHGKNYVIELILVSDDPENIICKSNGKERKIKRSDLDEFVSTYPKTTSPQKLHTGVKSGDTPGDWSYDWIMGPHWFTLFTGETPKAGKGKGPNSYHWENREFRDAFPKNIYAIKDWLKRIKAQLQESISMEDDNTINEKVDIDGRSKAYRTTVARLEHARKLREDRRKAMSENKWAGIYDDGSGQGAFIPDPVDLTFAEAMKVVEKYKALREKKKVLMGKTHESLGAAVQMNGDKYAMSEEELSPKQKEYRAFFDKALKKFGASSPAKMDDAKKRKFFDYVKANWKG